MQYKDTDTTQKTVVMKYLGSVDGYNTWTAALPKDVTTDISFFRFSTTNNIIYNSWHTKDNVNGELSPTAQNWIKNDEDLYPLQESRIVNGNRSLVYTAKRGNGYMVKPTVLLKDCPLVSDTGIIVRAAQLLKQQHLQPQLRQAEEDLLKI